MISKENYNVKYDKPIILYNNEICRTVIDLNKMTDNVMIIHDFKTENLSDNTKNLIVEILNNNWKNVEFIEGQQHMDVYINKNVFFRSFYDEDELYLHPKNSFIKPEKYNYYDVWGKNFT